MADAFRGLTLRIGADTTRLNSAFNSITGKASKAGAQLRKLSKALKFDTSNVSAMQSRLGLASDKALMTARAARALHTSIAQASNETVEFSSKLGIAGGKISEVAAREKNIFSSVQAANAEFNRVNRQLQTIYDAVRPIVAQLNGFQEGSKELAAYMEKLKTNFGGTSDKAKELTIEMKALIALAGEETNIGKQFGLEKSVADGKKLVEVHQRIHDSAKTIQHDFEALKTVEGFQVAKANLAAFNAELRKAISEETDFKAQLFAISGAPGLDKAIAKTRRLDASLEAATSSSREMAEAMHRVPLNMEMATARAASMHAEISATRSKLESLSEAMNKMRGARGFDEQRAKLTDVWTAAEKAKTKVDELRMAETKLEAALVETRQKISASEDAAQRSESAAADVKKWKNEVQKLNVKLTETKNKVTAADKALESAQMDVEFRKAYEQSIRLEASMRRLQSEARGTASVFSRMVQMRDIGYGLYSTVTMALGLAGRYAIQAAEDIDSAYRDMRKTVNGTEEEFEALKKGALDFSSTHVTSADQMLEIEAIGGQLGIAASDLGAFGETVSHLDIATNIDAETVAEQLGKMASVVGISVNEYDNFGDALVRLGNNMPVMESDIMTLSTRFMGMGEVVGMSADEMLGWAAAASATGQKPEAAGSSMQRFISKMETAVTKGGESLDQFADVAEMSSDDFAKAFETNASGAMYKFIEGLGNMQKNGESVNQQLVLMGINNVRDKQLLEGLAMQMANGTKESNTLKNALEMSTDAYHGMSTAMADGTVERAGDAAREAGRKAEGFSGQLQILKNNLQVLANEATEAMTPTITTIGDMFKDLTEFLRSLPAPVKQAIVTLASLAAAAGPVIIAVGSVGKAFTGLKDSIKAIRSTRLVARMFDSLSVSSGQAAGGMSLTTKTMAPLIAKMDEQRAAISRTNASIAEQKAQLESVKKARAQVANTAHPYAQSLVAQEQKITKSIAGSEKALKSQQRALGGMKVGTALGSLGMGIAQGAALMGAAVLIGMVGTAIADAVDKAEKYTRATDGMSKVTERLNAELETSEIGKGSYAASLSNTGKSAVQLQADFDSMTATNADLVNSFNKELDASDESAIRAQLLSEKMLDLAGNCHGSETKLMDLKQAAAEWADLTGNSVSVVNDFTGELSLERDAIVELTGAYKEMVKVQAYGEIYKQSLKAAQEAEVQLRSHRDELAEIEQEMQGYQQSWDEVKNTPFYRQSLGETEEGRHFLELGDRYDKLRELIPEEEREQAALQKTADTAEAMYNEQSAQYNLDKQRVEEIRKNTGAYREYQTALADTEGEAALYNLAHAMGYAGETADELQPFVDRLGEVGISANELASVGTEAFMRFREEAEDDLTKVSDAIDVYGSLDVEPKDITITENGTEVQGHLIDLDNHLIEIDGKMVTFHVEDDGSIATSAGAVEGLTERAQEVAKSDHNVLFEAIVDKASKAITDLTNQADTAIAATRTMTIDANTSSWWTKYNEIMNANNTKTIYIEEKRKSASGAISFAGVSAFARGGVFDKVLARIPMNASGGLNGIVARPTLTNIGWVGEDGAEAILHMRNAGGAVVPLTNRRYVRPFARAVASEMGGGAQVVNNNYSIGGISFEEGSDGAEAIKALYKAVKTVRRA